MSQLFRQLLEGFAKLVGLRVTDLQHSQQRLVALGVLLLGMLGFLLLDGILPPQTRIDLFLLSFGVSN